MKLKFIWLSLLLGFFPLGWESQIVHSEEWSGSGAEVFLLDEDDSAVGAIKLQFGSALGEYLSWDKTYSRFNISDTLRVFGNLEQDGNDLVLDADNAGTGSNVNIIANQGADNSGVLRYDAVEKQWQISNDGADFDALSAGAGAVLIPYINSSTVKRTVAISNSVSLRIYGGGFTPDTTVSVPGFDGVVGVPNVVSPEEMRVTVTPGTTEAVYDIVLANGASLNTAWAGNGEGLIEVKDLTFLVPGQGATTWNNAVGVNTGESRFVPDSTASGWNKGASFGTAPANTDFTLSFQPLYMDGQATGGYSMFGVDNADPNTNYNTIDYAIYLQNGANVYVYENGTSRGLHSSFTPADTFEIKRTGTTITYLKNGTVFYTSTVASSAAMVFDSSIYRYLGATNLSIAY